MEKNRGTVVAVVAALIVSVVSLGVAFAAFSRNLTINGNATVTSSTWDIHYSTTSGGTAANNATITNSASIVPTGSGGETGTLNAYDFTWSANFMTANEAVEYHFYIVNAGDYAANLTAPIVSQPTCTSNSQTVTCPFTYSVTKSDGSAFTGSDTLNSNSSVEVVVKAIMDSNYVGAANDITSSFSTVTFGYTQATN